MEFDFLWKIRLFVVFIEWMNVQTRPLGGSKIDAAPLGRVDNAQPRDQVVGQWKWPVFHLPRHPQAQEDQRHKREERGKIVQNKIYKKVGFLFVKFYQKWLNCIISLFAILLYFFLLFRSVEIRLVKLYVSGTFPENSKDSKISIVRFDKMPNISQNPPILVS